MISIIAITVLVLAETVTMETSESIKQLPIIDLKTKVPVDIQKDCGPGTKPCIIKCCAENEVLFKIPFIEFGFKCRNIKDLSKEYTSTAIQSVLNSTMYIATDSGKQVSFFEDFHLLYSDSFINKLCTHFMYHNYSAIINENGTAFWNQTENIMQDEVAPNFCMDQLLGAARTGGGVRGVYGFYFRCDDPSSNIQNNMYFAYGGLVSALFLVFTLVVHCLLKVLHGNPKGKLFIGFLINLMLFNVYTSWYYFSALEILENSSSIDSILQPCKWISPIGYYLFVSAFFWLNAMCYDIWRKFRSSKLPSSDSDVKKKMRLYSAYAIGMPLLCTSICLLIDQYGSDSVRPDFDHCQKDDIYNLWKRLYVRLPTGLVVLSNLVMWVLTMLNIRRVREEHNRIARKDSAKTRKDEILRKVYRNLSTLVGVNWLIEIILMPIPSFERWLEYLVFAPNNLLGVWIFLATVCSKDIFIHLCKRFGIRNRWTQYATTTQVSQNFSTSKEASKSKNKNTDNNMA